MRSYIPSSHHFGAQREMIAQEEHFPSTHFIRYSGYPSPTLSFRAQREIFLALRRFLLLSQNVSPFPLSRIGRYTPYRHFERREKSSLHSALSCSLRKRFPLFRYHTYGAIPVCKKRSLHFGRDDDTGIALSKHIRCSLHEINPFPHTVISSATRNLPCTLFFLVPFAEGFPFSAITHTALYRCTRKTPQLRSG